MCVMRERSVWDYVAIGTNGYGATKNEAKEQYPRVEGY